MSTKQGSGPQTSLDLIYANKGGNEVMFAEEIGDMKDKYPTRFAVHHVLSREERVNPLFSGRLDEEKLHAILDNVVNTEHIDEWFVCGPFELVQLVRDQLKELGIPEEKIRYELFTTGQPQDSQFQTGRAVEVDPEGDNVEVTILLDGRSSTVKSPVDSKESLLNAALRARPDAPFACAGGVCGTCRAKLTDGQVEMSENFALEPDEVDAGYILTCQSRPTTDCVSINYDA